MRGAAIVVGLLAAGAAGALALWLALRDPLGSLAPPEHGLDATIVSLAEVPHRHLEHVALRTQALGDIGFVVSLPDPLPAHRLPIVLVLGGAADGAGNIRSIPAAGDNAIVGYDWPMPVQFSRNSVLILLSLPDLYRRIMSVPGQIASALWWLTHQPWADGTRVSVLGYSLGALAAPAALDLAEHDGLRIGWTVIGYGGAPLGTLFAADPHIKPAFLAAALAPLLDLVLRPLEPTAHLPHLTGRFLILEGENDGLVPQKASTLLRDAVPRPKDVVVLPGGHMGTTKDKLALLQRVIAESEQWLIRQGAVNKAP